MANLIVLAFDEQDEAAEVRKALREMERKEALALDDAASVYKDEEGKIHVHGEMDRSVGIGAVGGGLLGLLLVGIFGPIGGIAIGALGGAAIGKLTDSGVDHKFVKEVGESLQPGGSALFLLVRAANPEYAIAALKPYKGKVLQTTLSPDAEDQLRRVLKKEM